MGHHSCVWDRFIIGCYTAHWKRQSDRTGQKNPDLVPFKSWKISNLINSFFDLKQCSLVANTVTRHFVTCKHIFLPFSSRLPAQQDNKNCRRQLIMTGLEIHITDVNNHDLKKMGLELESSNVFPLSIVTLGKIFPIRIRIQIPFLH